MLEFLFIWFEMLVVAIAGGYFIYNAVRKFIAEEYFMFGVDCMLAFTEMLFMITLVIKMVIIGGVR